MQSMYDRGGPRQDSYNSKREWLENRFKAICEQMKRDGMLGMPIEELCIEAAEVACWLGEEIGKESLHIQFAKRIEGKTIKEKSNETSDEIPEG